MFDVFEEYQKADVDVTERIASYRILQFMVMSFDWTSE